MLIASAGVELVEQRPKILSMHLVLGVHPFVVKVKDTRNDSFEHQKAIDADIPRRAPDPKVGRAVADE